MLNSPTNPLSNDLDLRRNTALIGVRSNNVLQWICNESVQAPRAINGHPVAPTWEGQRMREGVQQE